MKNIKNIKNKIKNMGDLGVRIIRWTMGALAILLLASIASFQFLQLGILENQAEVSLRKDLNTCNLFTTQQMQSFTQQKENKDLSQEQLTGVQQEFYFKCLEVNGRNVAEILEQFNN